MADSKPVDLSLFKEKIKLAFEREPLPFFGYRMDGGESAEPMAKKAGLGTPSCCDYLYIEANQADIAVLIEDTDLKRTINSLLKDKGHNQEVVIDLLRRENCLKVYGARLILCFLAQKSRKTADNLKGRRFFFWLVIKTGKNQEDNVKAIDQIVEYLEHKLSCSLGGAGLTSETKVFSSAKLKQKLAGLKNRPPSSKKPLCL